VFDGFNTGLGTYGATLGTYYADTDNDTWGDPATPGTYCSAGAEIYSSQGYVSNNFDTNASVQCTTNLVDCNNSCCDTVDGSGLCTESGNKMHTGVAECSGGTVSPAPSTQSACLAASGHWRRIGNNECGVCGGTVPTWYDDTDGDGLGNLNMPSTACTQPTGYVASSTDNYTLCNCSANNSTCYDSCSVCNGDNATCLDCAGTPNGPAWTDACGTCGNPPAPILWYKDTDGDSLGDPGDILAACTQPAGYVADFTDDNPDCSCASDSNCYDICGVCKTDSNSLGTATAAQCTGNDWVSGTCQKDGDGDGNYTYGGTNDNAMDCAGVCLNGFNGGTYGAVLGTYYSDTDVDGWGHPTTTGIYCSAGSEIYSSQGHVSNNYDTNSSVACTSNLIDCNNNCCDSVDSNGLCTESGNKMHTGVLECAGGTVSPAPSTQSACLAANGSWRGLGNNECGVCGGTVPTWYKDTDGDGLGDLNISSTACTQPTGYVSNSTDNNPDCSCVSDSNCYDICGVCKADSNSLGTATAAQCTGNDWVSGTCQKDGNADGNYTYDGSNDNAMDCAGVCLNGWNPIKHKVT
jgi:hypothetical protein